MESDKKIIETIFKNKNQHKHLKIIDPEKIIFCKALGNFSLLKMNDGNEIIIAKRLIVLEKKLKYNFFRCHHSFLVNISYVTIIDGTYCKLNNTEMNLPISRRRKAVFRKRMEEFNILV